MSTEERFSVALCVVSVASITTDCATPRLVKNGVGHRGSAQYIQVAEVLFLNSLLSLSSGDEVIFLFLVNLLRY